MTARVKKLAAALKLEDAVEDGVWTTHRGGQVFRYNNTDRPVRVGGVTVPPHEILEQ
jgi:hypothetical protein